MEDTLGGFLIVVCICVFCIFVFGDHRDIKVFNENISEKINNNNLLDSTDIIKIKEKLKDKDISIKTEIKAGQDEYLNDKFYILSLDNLSSSQCKSAYEGLKDNVNEIMINNVLFLNPNDKRITDEKRTFTFNNIKKFCGVLETNKVVFVKYLK